MSETVNTEKPSGPSPNTQQLKKIPKAPKGARNWKPIRRGPRRSLPESIIVSGDPRDGDVFFSYLPKRSYLDLAFTIGPKHVCCLVVCSKSMRSQFGNAALWYELASTLPLISKTIIKYEIVLQRPPRIQPIEPKVPVPVTATSNEESKNKSKNDDSKQKTATKTDKPKSETKTDAEDKKVDTKESKVKAEEGEGKTAEKPIDAEGIAKLIKESALKHVNVQSLTTNHVLRKDVLSSWEGFASLNSLVKLQLRGGFHIFAGDLPRGGRDRKPKIPAKVYTEEKSVIESYAWLNVLSDLLNGKHEVPIPFGGGVITRIGRGGTILKFSVKSVSKDNKPESKDNAEKDANKPRVFYFFFDDFALSLADEAKALHNLLTEYVNMLKLKALEKEREKAEKNKNKPSPKVNQNQKKKNAKPKTVNQREDPVAKYIEIKGLIEKHISKEKLSAGLVNVQSLLIKPGIPFANLEARLKDQIEHKAKVNKQAEKENQGMTEFLLDSLDEESFVSKTPKSLIERQKREEDRYQSSLAARNAKFANPLEEPVQKENKPPREKKAPKLIRGEDGTMTVPSKNRGAKKSGAKKAPHIRGDAVDHGVYTLNPYDLDAQQKLQQRQFLASESAKEAAKLLKPKAPPKKLSVSKKLPPSKKPKKQLPPAKAPVPAVPVVQRDIVERTRNVAGNQSNKRADPDLPPKPEKSTPPARYKKTPKVSKVEADALKYVTKKTKEQTNKLVRKATSKKNKKPKKDWYNNPDYLTVGMVVLGIVILLSIISYGTQSS
eukprot:TRINITY_DN993_c0_g1_i3.p1 TRINITY_DN993_c0_g1~~TRINITY_DN993_c0_g1_i3.p1  ORF type:complete len:775 (+),score=195.58 TRINITY_DN993_c0_g1_i3:102-2426(+)